MDAVRRAISCTVGSGSSMPGKARVSVRRHKGLAWRAGQHARQVQGRRRAQVWVCDRHQQVCVRQQGKCTHLLCQRTISVTCLHTEACPCFVGRVPVEGPCGLHKATYTTREQDRVGWGPTMLCVSDRSYTYHCRAGVRCCRHGEVAQLTGGCVGSTGCSAAVPAPSCLAPPLLSHHCTTSIWPSCLTWAVGQLL